MYFVINVKRFLEKTVISLIKAFRLLNLHDILKYKVMKKVLFFALLVLTICLNAQQSDPNISFDELSFDFGKIKEAEGPVTHKFGFTNTGAEPLILNNVKASCGCTTPQYTTEPVKPGDKGEISVTYNPKNRPGNFNKSITVTSNSAQPVTRLTITGNVEARQPTIEEMYRVNMLGVRFKTNSLGFGKVYKDQTSTKQIECINTLDKEAIVTFTGMPAYVTVDNNPFTLAPQEKKVVNFTMDGAKNPTWGHSYAKFNVLVNDEKEKRNLMTVSVIIEEDFSTMTPEEKANAAHAEFKSIEYDYGTIKQGEIVEHLFEFTNTGKSDLIIRHVKASCGCTAVKPEKNVLKPGETSSIKAVFNSRGRKGSQHKSITVITNDPDKPMYVLSLKGNIEDPPAPDSQ